jgi:hypothetical protein
MLRLRVNYARDGSIRRAKLQELSVDLDILSEIDITAEILEVQGGSAMTYALQQGAGRMSVLLELSDISLARE